MDLEFAVNGERFKIDSVDPSTTLLEFLRLNTPFKSVKLGCGEGKISLSRSLLFLISYSETLLFTNYYKCGAFMSCVMFYSLPELVKLT